MTDSSPPGGVGRGAGALLGLTFLVALLGASHVAGASGDHTLRIVASLEPVVLDVARGGLGVATLPASLAAFVAGEADGGLFSLLGAWSKLSIGRVGILDTVTSRRLPWLLFSALGVAACGDLVGRARGWWLGVVAGVVAGFPWLFESALRTRAESVAVSTLWLTSWFLVRGNARRGVAAWCSHAGLAVVFTLGLAVTRQALLVVPWLVVLMHCLRPRVRPGPGLSSAPAGLVLAGVLGPLLLALVSPSLWKGGALSWLRFVFAELNGLPEQPVVLPLFGWLFFAGVVLLAALAGVPAALEFELGRRFATGTFRPARDRTRGAATGLLATGFGLALVGCGLRPVWLSPGLAILGAWGLGRAASLLGPKDL